MKILETRNFDEALIELNEFKKEIKASSYQKPIEVKTVEVKNTLVELCADYLDFQSGINVPPHLIRNRSNEHINDCGRTLKRFCESLKLKKYNLETLPITAISDDEVGVFHEYLYSAFNPSKSSYNRQFRVMKAFITWVIDYKGIQMFNPFKKVELKTIIKDKTIITKGEYEKLLEMVNYENGFVEYGVGKRSNLYFDWLVPAFRLGLETGCRREELVTMKWNNLVELEKGKFIIVLDNLKVNRILLGKDEGEKTKSIPVTHGLMQLLIELGFGEKIGSDDYILSRPAELTDSYVMRNISRAFSHFIKLTTDKPLNFKNLRKTYITMLVMKLGDKAKIFTGHSDDEVLANHYISSAWVAGGLTDFKVF
jgi:integrase